MTLFTKQTNKLLSILNSLTFRSQKRSRPFFVLALVLVVFIFPLAQPVLAQSAPKIGTTLPSAASGGISFLANIVGVIIVPILQVITWFCALLVDIAAHFLSFMLKPDLYNFTTEPIIVIGWRMVRDVCNLFFLLILLFIAFCTILQIEKYHLKKTLLTLIIMALLINFSKPIAIFIFDGAQLLMNYFLGANQNYGTTITTLSGVADIVYRDLPGFIATLTKWDFSGAAVQYLFAIIFMFMYAVALFVIGIYLVIRIVALWLLVIISPLAFLAMAVPDFKKMSSDWWEALFKYSYVGPAMAFFLWLSVRLADSFFLTTAKRFNDPMASGVNGSPISMGSLVSFATVIVFLYASIIIAQKFGIQFASAITSRANKALSFFPQKGWGATKWGAKRGWNWFDREKLAKWGVSPKVWRDAWAAKTKEREEDVYGDAQSRAAEHLNKIKFLKGGRKVAGFYIRKREAEKDAKYQKEQDSMGTAPEIILPELKKLLEDKDIDPIEKQSRMRAYMSTLTRSRDFNEGVKQKFLKDIGMNKPMDAGEAPDNTAAIFSAFGMTDPKDQAYYAKRLGEIAMAHDDYHLWALEEKNKTKRMKMIYGKIGTIPEKKLALSMHSEAVHIKDDNGNVVGIPITAKVFLKRWSIMGFDKLNEARAQVKSDTLSDSGIKAHYNEYTRLLAEAKKIEARSQKATTQAIQNMFSNAATELRQQAKNESNWVETIATKGSTKKSPSIIADDLARIKQITGGGWNFKMEEKSKGKGAPSPDKESAEFLEKND